jgi:simple sugar transport system ATP-binding protein
MSTATEPVTTTLEVADIVKSYGAVRAVDGVSFAARGGEVVALLGDNGAGKSTLLKVLAGAEVPDSGTISLDGEPRRIETPRDAEALGIEMVYQDLALVETLDVTANLYLGRELRRRGLLGHLGVVDKKRMRAEGAQFFEALGSRIGSLRRPVEVLSGGQRQAVAISRAAARIEAQGGVVLLDEPTAALGVQQSRRVAELVQTLRSRGTLVVMVSHDVPACMAMATRLVIMRHGQKVADVSPGDATLDEVIRLMTDGRISPS